MGEGTLAARAEVLAARAALDGEIERLEAAGRAAVDIPAKVRANPARTAGLAAGAGFLLLGGPGRLFRGARNAVFGPPDPLPKSMLPDEIEKALRTLGKDGDRVRGTIEREFARYLKKTSKERTDRDLGGFAALMLTLLAKPAATRIGRQLAEELANPDRAAFEAALTRVRDRRASSGAGSDTPGA